MILTVEEQMMMEIKVKMMKQMLSIIPQLADLSIDKTVSTLDANVGDDYYIHCNCN